ncbi:hypothetical protein, partial [Faecalibaculum rodentium]|uniref:hypothetical protein n=1 Tax=Faecalibaculum rodentium TaxID=1702221 RepID=UPI003EBA9D82
MKNQGHRICKRYPGFWKKNAGQTKQSLFMDEAKGRIRTSGIWKCSAGFLNARPFMTGIRQVFRAGT